MTLEPDNAGVPESMDPVIPEVRKRPDFTRFVAVDTETTGLDPENGEIIEIGAVRFIDGVEADSFVTLVRPERGYPERNRRLTGIDPARLEKAENIVSALGRFREFIGDDLLVLHNADFDMKFLGHFAAKHGMEALTNPALCTQQLAAFIEPHAETFQLGTLADHWGVTVTDSHRALQDARSAGGLAIHLVDELKTWSKAFLLHLAAYRGKSINPIFDLLEYLGGEPDPSFENFRLGDQVKSQIESGQFGSIPGFPSHSSYPKHQHTEINDEAMREEILDGFKHGGFTLIDDMRSGSVHPSSSLLKEATKTKNLIVGVLDEEPVREIMGANWGTDGDSVESGMSYLGLPGEYVCLSRAFDASGKPSGWIEMSPYERIVLARWLGGTRSGRVSRLSWWILNNFTGLKGHLHSLCCSDFDCLACESSNKGPCFVKIARQKAESASCLLVDQRYFFSKAFSNLNQQSLFAKFPTCLIEQAEHLAGSARIARTEELDLDATIRRIKALAMERSSVESVASKLTEAASVLENILDAARRVSRSNTERGQSEYQTAKSIDDESWNYEEYSELADAVQQGAVHIDDIAKWFSSSTDDGCCASLGTAFGDISSRLQRFREAPVGWAVSMDATPHRNPKHVTFKLTPVDPGMFVRKFLEGIPSGVVATGRHLSQNGSFERTKAMWGIGENIPVNEKILNDNFPSQPPLLIPEDMLPPSTRTSQKYDQRKYLERTANLLKMIAEALGGHTVAIFSSHKDLIQVHDLLAGSSPRGCITLGQYQDGTKGGLVREYLTNQSTLLLGGRNFLDSVDLRPAGFTTLVLVKIPFPSPEDPLHKAAFRMMDQEGEDGLRSYLVPIAIDTINRWIDSLTAGKVEGHESNSAISGAVVLLDPRLLFNDWGEDFLTSLDARPVYRMPFRDVLSRLKEMAKTEVYQ